MKKKDHQVQIVEIVKTFQTARSRLKAAPTVESLFSAFFEIRNPQSAIRNPQSAIYILFSVLYRLQQMTAKRSDLMTPKAND